MENGQTETSFRDQKSKQPEIKSQLMGRDKYVLARHQQSRICNAAPKMVLTK
jgi:hypothetical protein